MKTIILASKSPVKLDTIHKILKETGLNYYLITYSIDSTLLPTQPVDSTLYCLKKRIEHIQSLDVQYDIIIAIENGLETNNDKITDICYASIVTKDHREFTQKSNIVINVPIEYYEEAKNDTPDNYDLKNLGLNVSVGQIIHDYFPEIPHDNWSAHESFGGISRTIQIADAFTQCLCPYLIDELTKSIDLYPDHPKPGIIFQDISKILADPEKFQLLDYLMAEKVRKSNIKITKIVGIDARGFIYGSMLARKLNCGFVMARKKGKLPGVTSSISYGTEYSQDTLEILNGIISENDQVLIVDDLVATGGSMNGVSSLIAVFNAKVAGYFTILQVTPLLEKAKLKLSDAPLIVLFDN